MRGRQVCRGWVCRVVKIKTKECEGRGTVASGVSLGLVSLSSRSPSLAGSCVCFCLSISLSLFLTPDPYVLSVCALVFFTLSLSVRPCPVLKDCVSHPPPVYGWVYVGPGPPRCGLGAGDRVSRHRCALRTGGIPFSHSTPFPFGGPFTDG